jgi:hypothetical protein
MQFDGVEKYLLLQKLKWTSFWFFRFFKFDILKGKNTPVTRAKLRRFFGPIVAKIINTFSGKNIYHKTSLDWGFLLFKLFKTALVFPKKNYKNVLINFIQMRTRIDKNLSLMYRWCLLKISSLLKTTKNLIAQRSCWDSILLLLYPNLKKCRPEYLISLGGRVQKFPKKFPKFKK